MPTTQFEVMSLFEMLYSKNVLSGSTATRPLENVPTHRVESAVIIMWRACDTALPSLQLRKREGVSSFVKR